MTELTADTPFTGRGAGPAMGAVPDSVSAFVRGNSGDGFTLHLMVEGLRCGGCVKKIEAALQALPAVDAARVNLTTRRLRVAFHDEAAAETVVRSVGELGFKARPFDPDQLREQDKDTEKTLLKAMGVAGFGAANVMLMSVGLWAGHAEGMGEATRDLLHWFSMIVALPCIAYAARPFFQSAWSALRNRATNMDVPISVGILLTTAMSVLETFTGGQHIYFESVLMLAFFLLLGRFLDDRSRARARSAAERLLSLGGGTVRVQQPDGSVVETSADWVRAGDRVLVAAGERFPVDATVQEGRSDIDTSLINGETAPVPVSPGEEVFAGMLNLSGPVVVSAKAVGEETLLAEIVRLMEASEQRRGRFVFLADRIVRFYTPVVHSLAALTFLGWVLFAGLAWQPSLMIAVAVLIITCPCALGLAVPAVQVAAGSLLMRNGILLKAANALERVAAVDTVVFDKTGTLTSGDLRPTDFPSDETAVRLAKTLAVHSRHPLCRALVGKEPVEPVPDIEEHPGQGMLWRDPDGGEVRLGSRDWCGVTGGEGTATGPELWLARPGKAAVRFAFEEHLRPRAVETVRRLSDQGVHIMLLSGDRPEAVAKVATAVGISDWRAQCSPADKSEALAALAADGRKTLMVGDGLNDAPALAAAAASLSPSSAADISQTAADAVFQSDSLQPVLTLVTTARRSQALVKQNFALALLYNLCAIPFAVAGFVTPLIAAVAMSASSILVTGNALRIAAPKKEDGPS